MGLKLKWWVFDNKSFIFEWTVEVHQSLKAYTYIPLNSIIYQLQVAFSPFLILEGIFCSVSIDKGYHI